MHAISCDHHWETQMSQMMAVLSLPPRPHVLIDCVSDSNSEDENIHFLQEPFHFTIRALLDYYEAEETIEQVRCRICNVVNAHAQKKPRFQFTSDIIIFRINRYEIIDGENRKSDDVITPVMHLMLGNIGYALMAVVEHAGSTCKSGHYQTVLRTESGWERRSDCCKVAFSFDAGPPVFKEKDIYIVVYAKSMVIQGRQLSFHQDEQIALLFADQKAGQASDYEDDMAFDRSEEERNEGAAYANYLSLLEYEEQCEGTLFSAV